MLKPSREGYFPGTDRHRLYYQAWRAAKPRAVLLFIHGLNEHSGRYQNPINYFYEKNYSIYAYDHRGHGRSDGIRSYVDRFKQFWEDLAAFHRFVIDAEKGAPLFLIGHSMGAQILLNYMASCSLPVNGFVTSSANIEMCLKINPIKKLLATNLSVVMPKLRVGNDIDPKWISRDLEVVRAYKQDALVPKDITLRLAAEIIANQQKIYSLAAKIRQPCYLMHGGDDRICSARGSEKFFNQLGSSDRTLTIYDDFYHEIFNEPGREEVFKDIQRWIEKRL